MAEDQLLLDFPHKLEQLDGDMRHATSKKFGPFLAKHVDEGNILAQKSQLCLSLTCLLNSGLTLLGSPQHDRHNTTAKPKTRNQCVNV